MFLEEMRQMQLDIITESMKNALNNLNSVNGDRLHTDLRKNGQQADVKLKNVLQEFFEYGYLIGSGCGTDCSAYSKRSFDRNGCHGTVNNCYTAVSFLRSVTVYPSVSFIL